MVSRHGSFRKKTRHKLQKGYKDKGKVSLTKFFQEFKQGDKVVLKAEPAYQKGMYYPRFHGRVATVKGTQGTCYAVEVKDGGKIKELVVHPVHLTKK